MGQSDWLSGLGIGIQAYETALATLEREARYGFRFARRVREHAHKQIVDHLLLRFFLSGLLKFSKEPDHPTIDDCNLAISAMWKRVRNAKFRQQLVEFVGSFTEGTAFRVCGYCAQVLDALPIKGRYCSERCLKGTYNRRDNLRRQEENRRRSQGL